MSERAYNLILVNIDNTNYALLGLEGGKTWNLLGGQMESGDKNRGTTAARELYEESVKLIDKRGDRNYWSMLPFYEHGKHKVFIHDQLNVNINQLNYAAHNAIHDDTLGREYKEMHRYRLVKLTNLIEVARSQLKDGQSMIFAHPQELNMMIDGWLLYTLKYADLTALNRYLY